MRTVLRYLFCGLLFFSSFSSKSQQQQEANIWYFGRFLGLDFNSGTAVPLNDGKINTTEGVATISDANGNLLFYTDGITIWNKLHLVMQNGTGLFGNVSSTQSAVIVPFISDPARYYVFTVDAQGGPMGLTYSIVNMTLDAGLGAVETKNLPLQSNVVEKVTAVRHCNNRDVWVLAHGVMNDAYYAFLVTSAGVNTTPVISNTGAILPGPRPPSSADSSSLGYLKASPDGKKIAAAHFTVSADVSDFNNATGVVSNTYDLFLPTEAYYLAYGIEFSPDSKLVYTTVFYTDPSNFTKNNALLQYDVSLGTVAAVQASKQVIAQNSDPIQTFAALQVGPDGKMYMAKNTYKHIAAINSPNIYGPGCGFNTNAIQWTLPSQSSSFGLPTFIQSYFYPPDSFTYTVNCPGLSVNFNYTPQPGVISVLWNFGDPASGTNNTSTQNNPVHTYTAAGTYNVELVKFTNCGTDTLRKQVTTSGININLGNDTLICGGTNIILNTSASGAGVTYLWQDGSTNQTFTATTSGLYWVQGSNSLGCSFRDTINVTFKPVPVFNLGNDTTICENDTLTLNATVAGATTYLWSTGAGSPTIKVYQPGVYWCAVNKEGCIFKDTLALGVATRPVVNLGADIATCNAPPVVLDATNPTSTYLWQNGSTNPTFTATTSGLYWVEVKNNAGCTKRDSINIAFNTTPVFNLGNDTQLCEGDTLTLNATVGGATSYLWNTGATTPTIKVFQAGTYWCEVNNGCAFRDTLVITAVNPRPVVNLGADISSCGVNPITLTATNPNSTYLWHDGSTNPTYTASNSGLYWVEVRNNAGCTKRDSINILFNPIPVFNLGPNLVTDICQGDTLTLDATVPGGAYLWSTGAGTSTIRVSQPGLYWCEVTRQGCSFRDTLIINSVKPLPAINLGPDQTVCEGTTVTLNAANPNSTYLWQDGSTNPIFNATAQGTYYVEVDLNGCKNSDTIKITHNLKPRFTLGPDQVVCPGSPLVLTPALNPGWQLSWQDGSTASVFTVSQPGQYSLTATNNCGSTIDNIDITKGVCKVFMPSAFTPNGDGLNDYFKALGTETVSKFDLKIFNRWGELVFQTADKSKGWDGKVGGVMQSTAVFIYTVQYVDLNTPQPQVLKGTVTLIR